MNERIRELAEQAGLKVNADGEIGPAFFGSVDAGYKKFAELIVKECSKVIDEETVGELDDYAMRRIEHCSWMVKQHFGVDE